MMFFVVLVTETPRSSLRTTLLTTGTEVTVWRGPGPESGKHRPITTSTLFGEHGLCTWFSPSDSGVLLCPILPALSPSSAEEGNCTSFSAVHTLPRNPAIVVTATSCWRSGRLARRYGRLMLAQTMRGETCSVDGAGCAGPLRHSLRPQASQHLPLGKLSSLATKATTLHCRLLSFTSHN